MGFFFVGGVSINKFVFMQVIVSFQKMPKARRKRAAATSTEGRGRGSRGRGRGRGRGRQEQVDVIEDVPPTIVQPQSVGQPQTTSEAGRSLDNVSSVNIINGNIPSTSTSSSINNRQGQIRQVRVEVALGRSLCRMFSWLQGHQMLWVIMCRGLNKYR